MVIVFVVKSIRNQFIKKLFESIFMPLELIFQGKL